MMTTTTLTASTSVSTAPVLARVYLDRQSIARTECTSPALLDGRVVEFREWAMALHLSGVRLHRAMTVAQVSRAALVALVEHGPFEVSRQGESARLANLCGQRMPWTRARMQQCYDLAHLVVSALNPVYTPTPAREDAAWVELTGMHFRYAPPPAMSGVLGVAVPAPRTADRTEVAA